MINVHVSSENKYNLIIILIVVKLGVLKIFVRTQEAELETRTVLDGPG